jgi:hypothetical protein
MVQGGKDDGNRVKWVCIGSVVVRLWRMYGSKREKESTRGNKQERERQVMEKGAERKEERTEERA